MSSSVEGFLDWDGYRTWYRVVGEPETVPAQAACRDLPWRPGRGK